MAAPIFQPISKVEAAERQLDTAIDLYFSSADSLAVYTLAFASFKMLFDLYPHHNDDGFAKQIDQMIAAEGWRSMSGPANFLKHADRDPDALLAAHHPKQGMSVIGLATLLYRRISGDFTLKMRAFDFWVEQEGHDVLGIEEIDTNAERSAAHKEIRDAVNALPDEAKMFFAQKQYRDFLENYDRYVAMVDEAEAAGLTITDILDGKARERLATREAEAPET